MEQKINFNSASQLSGVSKTFFYNNYNIKKRIKELEEENKKLKEQLELLRGKLHEKM